MLNHQEYKSLFFCSLLDLIPPFKKCWDCSAPLKNVNTFASLPFPTMTRKNKENFTSLCSNSTQLKKKIYSLLR